MKPIHFLIIVFLFAPSIALGAVSSFADCPPRYDAGAYPCEFQLSGWNYAVEASGIGTRTDRTGNIQNFILGLEEMDFIEGVQFFAHHDDVLLVLSITGGDGGFGRVMLLDGTSLLSKWSAHIPGFNLSQGLIEGEYLYQAAIGFVSKIDLSSGQFVWEHDGLYDVKQYSFNAFNTPEISGDNVVFKEAIPSGVNYNTPRTIVVNNDTGKIDVR